VTWAIVAEFSSPTPAPALYPTNKHIKRNDQRREGHSGQNWPQFNLEQQRQDHGQYEEYHAGGQKDQALTYDHLFVHRSILVVV
jgi:hypothetical protein